MNKNKKERSNKKAATKPARSIKQPLQQSKLFWLFIIICITITWISYLPSFNNALTNWDDQEYITNNNDIKELTPESISKAFKTYHMGNYHPLTMISYAIEYNFTGDNVKTFHTTNFIFHILNTLLVLYFIYLLTNNYTIAFITALLFGIHPMHVESVAWVAERKDVLYTFFYLLALCAYTKYIHSNKKTNYFLALLFFIGSLLSKGMAVTLPVIMIITDLFLKRKLSTKTILEKIPFFVLTIVFGVVAIYAQESAKAIGEFKSYTVFERFLFVCYSITTYIWKAIAPTDLRTFYGYPLKVDESYPAIYYAAPVILGILTTLFIIFLRKNKIAVYGTLFFLVTIFLVLQILPVGGAIISERYTYIPYIGLFFIIAVYIEQLINNYKNIAIVSFAILAFTLAYLSHERCKVWKDSITLWDDVIAKEQTSPKAYNNRGDAHNIAKNYDLAIKDLDKSLQLKFDYPDAYYNRGLSYYYLGKYEQAISDYTNAIKYNPSLAVAYYNRSGTYYAQQKFKSALDDALKAAELGKEVDPKYIEALQEGIKHAK